MARHGMLVLLLALGAAAMPVDVIELDAVTGVTVGPTGAPSTAGQCSCNQLQVWNDVIFIVDASQATGQAGLNQMWGYIQTMLGWFNVQPTSYKGSNYTMRVGFIVYASKPQVVATLGQWSMDDIYNVDQLPFFAGDSGTNLEGALQLANTQFDGTNHRSNAKKVIVVMATTYNDGAYSAPQQTASSFRENGGILMVYDYIELHGGSENALLQQIASPGYFFNSNDNTLDDLQNAQCDANCFCDKNLASFSNSLRGYPTGGCFSTSTIQNNFRIAQNRCVQQGGILSSDLSDAENTFLFNQFPVKNNFYIGLSYNQTSGTWVWSDGTPLGNYHPWLGGVTPPGTDGKQCVYVAQSNLQWVSTDCRNGYVYNCQTIPCDSTHYCA